MHPYDPGLLRREREEAMFALLEGAPDVLSECGLWAFREPDGAERAVEVLIRAGMPAFSFSHEGKKSVAAGSMTVRLVERALDMIRRARATGLAYKIRGWEPLYFSEPRGHLATAISSGAGTADWMLEVLSRPELDSRFLYDALYEMRKASAEFYKTLRERSWEIRADVVRRQALRHSLRLAVTGRGATAAKRLRKAFDSLADEAGRAESRADALAAIRRLAELEAELEAWRKRFGRDERLEGQVKRAKLARMFRDEVLIGLEGHLARVFLGEGRERAAA